MKAALPHADRAKIASNLRIVQELHSCLNAAGWLQFDSLADGQSPLHLLYTRQTMLDVPPLKAAVEAAKRLKREGDVCVYHTQR